MNGTVVFVENDVWGETLKLLELGMTHATFESCLRGSRIEEVRGGRYIIGVQNAAAVAWLEHRLKAQVLERLGGVVGGPVEVEFVVQPPAEKVRVMPPLPAPVFLPVEEGRNGNGLMSAYHVLTTEWPEPVWVAKGKLPAGLALFGGKPKIGKSWLALQLARATTRGEETLGTQFEAGRFLYLALEDTPRRLRDRMERQGWPLDERLKLSSFMLRSQFEEQIGDLGNGGAEILAEMINRSKYRLVIIDTFARAIRGDQNDNDLMTMALGPIQEVAHQHNCVVLLIDHHRKLFSAEPDVVLDILGATEKGGVADTIWGLYRERGKFGAKLAIIGKDVEEQTIMLQINPETGLWVIDGNGDPNAIELTARRQEILDAMADLGRARVGEISRAIEQNRGNTYGRLQDLVNAHLIRRTMDKEQAVWYELVKEEEE